MRRRRRSGSSAAVAGSPYQTRRTPFPLSTVLSLGNGKYRGRTPSAYAALSTACVACLSASARPARTAEAAAPEPGQRLVTSEELERLEQPRRDLRPGDREADGLKRLARLEPEPLGQPA